MVMIYDHARPRISAFEGPETRVAVAASKLALVASRHGLSHCPASQAVIKKVASARVMNGQNTARLYLFYQRSLIW